MNDTHTPCTIRAAAAHRVPSCGSGAGGWKRWERYEPARRLGQEPRSEEQRQRWDGGHADLECGAPSGINRLRLPWATYRILHVLHTRGWHGLPTVQSEWPPLYRRHRIESSIGRVLAWGYHRLGRSAATNYRSGRSTSGRTRQCAALSRTNGKAASTATERLKCSAALTVTAPQAQL